MMLYSRQFLIYQFINMQINVVISNSPYYVKLLDDHNIGTFVGGDIYHLVGNRKIAGFILTFIDNKLVYNDDPYIRCSKQLCCLSIFESKKCLCLLKGNTIYLNEYYDIKRWLRIIYDSKQFFHFDRHNVNIY